MSPFSTAFEGIRVMRSCIVFIGRHLVSGLFFIMAASVAMAGGAGDPGVFQFSATEYFAYESAGSVTVTVERVDGFAEEVDIDYATTDGTATAGSDYTAQSGTLFFPEIIEDPIPITIPITNDTTAEPVETFTISISNPTSGATLGSPATATVHIVSPGRYLTVENREKYAYILNEDLGATESPQIHDLVALKSPDCADPASCDDEWFAVVGRKDDGPFFGIYRDTEVAASFEIYTDGFAGLVDDSDPAVAYSQFAPKTISYVGDGRFVIAGASERSTAPTSRVIAVSYRYSSSVVTRVSTIDLLGVSVTDPISDSVAFVADQSWFGDNVYVSHGTHAGSASAPTSSTSGWANNISKLTVSATDGTLTLSNTLLGNTDHEIIDLVASVDRLYLLTDLVEPDSVTTPDTNIFLDRYQASNLSFLTRSPITDRSISGDRRLISTDTDIADRDDASITLDGDSPFVAFAVPVGVVAGDDLLTVTASADCDPDGVSSGTIPLNVDPEFYSTSTDEEYRIVALKLCPDDGKAVTGKGIHHLVSDKSTAPHLVDGSIRLDLLPWIDPGLSMFGLILQNGSDHPRLINVDSSGLVFAERTLYGFKTYGDGAEGDHGTVNLARIPGSKTMWISGLVNGTDTDDPDGRVATGENDYSLGSMFFSAINDLQDGETDAPVGASLPDTYGLITVRPLNLQSPKVLERLPDGSEQEIFMLGSYWARFDAYSDVPTNFDDPWIDPDDGFFYEGGHYLNLQREFLTRPEYVQLASPGDLIGRVADGSCDDLDGDGFCDDAEPCVDNDGDGFCDEDGAGNGIHVSDTLDAMLDAMEEHEMRAVYIFFSMIDLIDRGNNDLNQTYMEDIYDFLRELQDRANSEPEKGIYLYATFDPLGLPFKVNPGGAADWIVTDPGGWKTIDRGLWRSAPWMSEDAVNTFTKGYSAPLGGFPNLLTLQNFIWMSINDQIEVSEGGTVSATLDLSEGMDTTTLDFLTEATLNSLYCTEFIACRDDPGCDPSTVAVPTLSPGLRSEADQIVLGGMEQQIELWELFLDELGSIALQNGRPEVLDRLILSVGSEPHFQAYFTPFACYPFGHITGELVDSCGSTANDDVIIDYGESVQTTLRLTDNPADTLNVTIGGDSHGSLSDLVNRQMLADAITVRCMNAIGDAIHAFQFEDLNTGLQYPNELLVGTSLITPTRQLQLMSLSRTLPDPASQYDFPFVLSSRIADGTLLVDSLNAPMYSHSLNRTSLDFIGHNHNTLRNPGRGDSGGVPFESLGVQTAPPRFDSAGNSRGLNVAVTTIPPGGYFISHDHLIDGVRDNQLASSGALAALGEKPFFSAEIAVFPQLADRLIEEARARSTVLSELNWVVADYSDLDDGTYAAEDFSHLQSSLFDTLGYSYFTRWAWDFGMHAKTEERRTLEYVKDNPGSTFAYEFISSMLTTSQGAVSPALQTMSIANRAGAGDDGAGILVSSWLTKADNFLHILEDHDDCDPTTTDPDPSPFTADTPITIHFYLATDLLTAGSNEYAAPVFTLDGVIIANDPWVQVTGNEWGIAASKFMLGDNLSDSLTEYGITADITDFALRVDLGTQKAIVRAYPVRDESSLPNAVMGSIEPQTVYTGLTVASANDEIRILNTNPRGAGAARIRISVQGGGENVATVRVPPKTVFRSTVAALLPSITGAATLDLESYRVLPELVSNQPVAVDQSGAAISSWLVGDELTYFQNNYPINLEAVPVTVDVFSTPNVDELPGSRPVNATFAENGQTFGGSIVSGSAVLGFADDLADISDDTVQGEAPPECQFAPKEVRYFATHLDLGEAVVFSAVSDQSLCVSLAKKNGLEYNYLLGTHVYGTAVAEDVTTTWIADSDNTEVVCILQTNSLDTTWQAEAVVVRVADFSNSRVYQGSLTSLHISSSNSTSLGGWRTEGYPKTREWLWGGRSDYYTGSVLITGVQESVELNMAGSVYGSNLGLQWRDEAGLGGEWRNSTYGDPNASNLTNLVFAEHPMSQNDQFLLTLNWTPQATSSALVRVDATVPNSHARADKAERIQLEETRTNIGGLMRYAYWSGLIACQEVGASDLWYLLEDIEAGVTFDLEFVDNASAGESGQLSLWDVPNQPVHVVEGDLIACTGSRSPSGAFNMSHTNSTAETKSYLIRVATLATGSEMELSVRQPIMDTAKRILSGETKLDIGTLMPLASASGLMACTGNTGSTPDLWYLIDNVPAGNRFTVTFKDNGVTGDFAELSVWDAPSPGQSPTNWLACDYTRSAAGTFEVTHTNWSQDPKSYLIRVATESSSSSMELTLSTYQKI